MSLVKVTFPGGKKIGAEIKGFTVMTDQPESAGGENSAPTPFDMFWVSLATCSGITAQSFCKNKGIETEGLGIEFDGERNMETGMYEKIKIILQLPNNFPEKYRGAIERSLELCTVKRHIMNPPEFSVEVK